MLQCFDLSSFLDANKMVSGQRWRCLVCEEHISYYDLQLDRLVEKLLHEYRNELVPTERDRIEFSADGSTKLLEQKRKERKKRSLPESARSSSSTASLARKKAKAAEPEVIVLD
jgi:hypothetical protein